MSLETKAVQAPVHTIKDEESVRIDIDKLDRLVNLSGEMLISRIRLSELSDRLFEKVESNSQVYEEFRSLVMELIRLNESIDFSVSSLGSDLRSNNCHWSCSYFL